MDGRSIMLAACHEGYEWSLRGAVYHVMARGNERKAIFHDQSQWLISI
jgi:hypothetical protein